jgi:predicted Zn-dependent peptidase
MALGRFLYLAFDMCITYDLCIPRHYFVSNIDCQPEYWSLDWGPCAIDNDSKKRSFRTGLQLTTIRPTNLTVYIPIGSTYHREGHPAGLPHFYEHMTFHRSEAFPLKDSFSKWVSSKGGEVNAVTRPFCTTYTVEIPVLFIEEAWNGLYNLLFHPQFTEDDVATERTIVANERDQRKWYPGESEIGHYLSTSWFEGRLIEKDHLFGSDGNLGAITPQTLSDFNKNYSSRGVQVFVTGPENYSFISDSLQNITTSEHTHDVHRIIPHWKQSTYHTHEFVDIDKPVYFLGSLYELPNNQERAAIHFILEYLTDFSTGPLHEWLRHELGWTYGISYERVIQKSHEIIVMEIPLQSEEQVTTVRSEIFNRIESSLTDRGVLERELERQLGRRVFFYQKTGYIVEDAINDLTNYENISSETEYVSYLKLCTDPEYIQGIYHKFFNPELRGEFCALPKE